MCVHLHLHEPCPKRRLDESSKPRYPGHCWAGLQFGLCVCTHESVCACVCMSEFVRTITSTIVDWFHCNLTQMFSIMCRCVIWNIHSGRPKGKVTLEGQFFVRTRTPTILDGFQYNFARLPSIMSRCASWRFHLGRSKVKVMQAQRVIPGQPSSFSHYTLFCHSCTA